MKFGKPKPAEGTHELSVEETIAEGALLAAAAIRMAVINQAVTRIFRDKESLELEWFEHAVQEQLRTLAHEKKADAQRLKAEIKMAAHTPGRAEHEHDYRWADVKPLKLRRKVLKGLASYLVQLSHDHDFVTKQAEQSKLRAYEEAQEAIATQTLRAVRPDAFMTDQERNERLEQLRLDLTASIPTAN